MSKRLTSYPAVLLASVLAGVLACHSGPAWATTLNQFNVQLDKGTLTLQLATDQAVAPQSLSPVGAGKGESIILLPNVQLAPTLQQAGQATVLDTQGRFTAKAISTDKGVQIILSNLQTKPLSVSVSQHRSQSSLVVSSPLRQSLRPSVLAGLTTVPNPLPTLSSVTTKSRGSSPLGFHVATALAPTMGLPAVGQQSDPSQASLAITPTATSIVGTAPVVPMDQWPAIQSQHWGAWPFASSTKSAFASSGLLPSLARLGGSGRGSRLDRQLATVETDPNDAQVSEEAPATTMSPMGLLQGVDAKPAKAVEASRLNNGGQLIQQLSIQPILKELPPWLLPVLGLFLGGVGLLAVIATLLLVGATLRHWPAKRLLAGLGQASQTLAPVESALSADTALNVSHAQVQGKPLPLAGVSPLKSGFAQAPPFALNKVVLPIKPPTAPSSVADVIKQTHRYDRRLKPAVAGLAGRASR
jgi:hypothetical protein